MEIHQHSKPPHSEQGHKKWHHYIWEFLMLFLAVFCGFLAENIREHVVEKRREQQFVKSLVQDIKLDLKNLDSLDKGWAIDYNNASKEKDLLAGNDVITNSVPALNLWDTSTGWDDFVPSDGTIQELKSSEI